MRHLILTVLALLLLAAWPVQAQEPTAERVLVDATLYIEPPAHEGLCMAMTAGQVTVTVQRVTEANGQQRPARFNLYGYMIDPDARLELLVTNQSVTTTTHLRGSPRYCWDVSIDAPETEGMSRSARSAFTQTVAVTIVHRPD